MIKNLEKASPPSRPMWKGRISIGLVNVPVKIYSMIHDQAFSFRLLHREDGHPLKYERVCVKDNKVVDWKDVVKGYEVRKNEFAVFEKEEFEAIKPESDERIRIDKFIDYLTIDPVYFNSSYIFETLGKAGIGKITLRTKEYPSLIHVWKGALVLTTLRYAYEVVDPRDMEELSDIKKPSKEELDMAVKIIQNLSGEFDISEYHDTYREKVEDLIEKKMKGETVVAETPKKEEVKELMAALEETVKQLKRK
jgi:DNA end-binding protein Ku